MNCKSQTPCSQCGKPMDMTPVCCECGKIPIAESSFRQLETALAEARTLIHRYRTETPLGYQPHMIADKADHWLIANATLEPQGKAGLK